MHQLVQVPVQVTFRHMEPSEAVRGRVLDLMQRLQRFHGRITRCQVVVEAPAKHQRHGSPFVVKIDAQIPGDALHVHSERLARETHADVYVALSDAFDSLKRKLCQ